jgi:hypothetical protein
MKEIDLDHLKFSLDEMLLIGVCPPSGVNHTNIYTKICKIYTKQTITKGL